MRNALFGVASGAYDVALVMGADKIRETSTKDMVWEWEAMARDMAWDYPLGLVSPAGFALHVARYLHESPATKEHMAMVAVKNHRHGVDEPEGAVAVRDHDGAGAERADRRRRRSASTTARRRATARPPWCSRPRTSSTGSPTGPVWIRGVGLGLDSVMHQHKQDMTTFPATVRAAKQAFGMAGLTPSDVDVAEVHDFFTGIELISYEDLGFADRFGAYKLVEAEVTSVGGSLPVNPERRIEVEGTPARCHRRRAVRGTLRPACAARPSIRSTARESAWRTTSVDPTAVSAVTILEGPGTDGD